MHDSLLVAAPLMIAAIVMAFRFVGCGIDADPLPYGTRPGTGMVRGPKPLTVKANLTGTGTLTGKASFPGHDATPKTYDTAGSYAFAIPFWCTRIDLVLLGAGGGGSYAATRQRGRWRRRPIRRPRASSAGLRVFHGRQQRST